MTPAIGLQYLFKEGEKPYLIFVTALAESILPFL
jgi:hypothetical protein